jgi:hypothetical protein
MTCDSIKTFTIRMTKSQIAKAEVASGEIECLLNNAAGVFDLLQTGLSLGHFDPEDPNIISLCELSRRALWAATNDEGNQMTNLSSVLLRAKGETS